MLNYFLIFRRFAGLTAYVEFLKYFVVFLLVCYMFKLILRWK